jgi:hypothetical protein
MAAVACVLVLSFAVLGCGSSSTSSSSSTSASTSASTSSVSDATAQWRAKVQQQCRENEAAVERLGYIHITYGGIVRIGLPAVKQKLDVYLGRLLAVMRAEGQRGDQLTPPPQFHSFAVTAHRLNAQEQSITESLRTSVDKSQTARELSAAFTTWLRANEPLEARSEVLARDANVLACLTGHPQLPAPQSSEPAAGQSSA